MGMYCTLTELTEANLTAPEAGREPARGAELSLEKAWHGLDELLRRARPDDPEAGFLLAGGWPIGPDRGYGPTRVFDPDELPALVSVLGAFANEERAGYFGELKAFVAGIASRGSRLGVAIA